MFIRTELRREDLGELFASEVMEPLLFIFLPFLGSWDRLRYSVSSNEMVLSSVKAGCFLFEVLSVRERVLPFLEFPRFTVEVPFFFESFSVSKYRSLS